MGIANPGIVEHVQQRRQQWVADIPMQGWHRSWFDLSIESTAEHHISTCLFESREQFRQLLEIVGGVGIADDDVLPTSGRKPFPVGIAIPHLVGCDDSCTTLAGNLWCSITRTIAYNDFCW